VFKIKDDIEFSTVIDRDVPSVLGAIYSNSGSTPERFGERRADFEQNLKSALLRMSPSGSFREKVETGVIVAARR
jgi:hypothetical protein